METRIKKSDFEESMKNATSNEASKQLFNFEKFVIFLLQSIPEEVKFITPDMYIILISSVIIKLFLREALLRAGRKDIVKEDDGYLRDQDIGVYISSFLPEIDNETKKTLKENKWVLNNGMLEKLKGCLTKAVLAKEFVEQVVRTRVEKERIFSIVNCGC